MQSQHGQAHPLQFTSLTRLNPLLRPLLARTATLPPETWRAHGPRGASCAASVASAAGRSWGGEEADWELEPYTSDAEEEADEAELTVLLPPGGGGGRGAWTEFAAQNVLAAVLLGAAALSFGSVMLKLLAVGLALVSAAFRYVTVGAMLLVLLALFA